MKINDYININTDKVYNNKEFRLYYDGYLTEVSNNEPIKLRYGDQNWDNVNTIEMKKDVDNRLYADIKLNNFDKFNFCFEYNNVWDNNFSNNYSFEISKFNLDNYNENEEDLEDYLSDNFLAIYNLNKKDINDIPYVTAESEIYENASNATLVDTQLRELKESLEKLFPENNEENIDLFVQEFEEQLSQKFAEAFSKSSLEEDIKYEEDDDFIPIEYNLEKLDELEIYKPVTPYRAKLIAEVEQREMQKQYMTNIVLEDTKIVLTSKVQYINLLREVAKKNELQQILRLGTEEEAQFLVVSPYSKVDIYDNSFIGTIKRYAAYISKSIKKVYHYLKENLSSDEIK